jgi:hypothetical protein
MNIRGLFGRVTETEMRDSGRTIQRWLVRVAIWCTKQAHSIGAEDYDRIVAEETKRYKLNNT